MIEFQEVSFGYAEDTKVIDSAAARFKPGLTLLVGLNGCGKSTLLKLAAGVEKPDGGRILVAGKDLWRDEAGARRELTYLPEFPDLTPYATLKDIMRLVCRLRGVPLGRGQEALEFFGLEDHASSSVRELSLGQKRRAVFASALIGEPSHVLLDEPLEAMDLRIQKGILDWIEKKTASGAVLLVVSHALGPFTKSAARAATVQRGKIELYEDLPPESNEKLLFLERLARGEAPAP